MLRFDPFFRDFGRLTQQLLGSTVGTPARPALIPADAWREGDRFVVQLDLPGVKADSIDIQVEQGALTVRAERPPVEEGRHWLVSERPHGVFSRQIQLGKGLDVDNISAGYTDGVLQLTIPVANEAKPRKVAVLTGAGKQQAINA